MTLEEKFEQWAEEYKQQGRLEGLQEARLEGAIRALQRLLTRRFGPLPSEVITRISGASFEEVETWCDRLVDATSLAEVLRP